MRKTLMMLPLFLFCLCLLSCQRKHPVKVHVSPKMKEGNIASVAVLPFTTSVHETDDPDKDAPRTIQKFFFESLGTRTDYKFVTPSTVQYAAERQGLDERRKKFLKEWPKTQKPDMGFFSSLAEVLKCDAFLIGTVDVWQKDEADYQENTTPATYVGATITILDAGTGEILFQASDEDYLEGMRTETEDRQLVVGASGNVYKDLGARMFKAPPFEDVVQKVVKALVSSLPQR